MSLIVLLLVVAVAVVLMLAARKPDEFKVTRSAVYDVSQGTLFEHVGDLHRWEAWSPWARMDPDAKTTFSGPADGVGSSFAWDGKKTGQGNMTITEYRPHELVRFRLEFIKPMKAVNTAEFLLTAEGGKTRLTWSMFGPLKFSGKIMHTFMDCEKMVGGQFEDGLKNLREIVEKPKKAA